MRLLSLNIPLTHPSLTIETATDDTLVEMLRETAYDYLIVHGGDGTIRRTLQQLRSFSTIPTLILHPTGSFNVIAKQHKVPDLAYVFSKLAKGERLPTSTQQTYQLNEMIFLFSAGNMGDIQHIFLSETLRFGWLKKGMTKYALALLFLLPIHLVMTPFMLASRTRFFIFTPLTYIPKLGSFYGVVPKELTIDLENEHNLLELDGDIVTIQSSLLHIKEAKSVKIVTK